MSRADYLKSEYKRVNDELTDLLKFSLSTDQSVISLREYKNKILDEIMKLVN